MTTIHKGLDTKRVQIESPDWNVLAFDTSSPNIYTGGNWKMLKKNKGMIFM